MKLQAASKKEISRIALGTLVCDGIMVAALFLLSEFGIGTFSLPRILLGAACGSLVAIANFTILCLTVQDAVEIESKKKMKQKFQLSYNLRLIVQAVWVVAAFLIPQVHFVAGAAPILFPNVVILFLQIRGKLVSDDGKAPPAQPEAKATEQDEEDDHPGPFEV
ncbi:MAG: ATP synthase subunit I [Firmicutes bacterium]|nr:ATP synthase subunit I [Bacillota bacterium]